MEPQPLIDPETGEWNGTYGIVDEETGVGFAISPEGIVLRMASADGQPIQVDPGRWHWDDGEVEDLWTEEQRFAAAVETAVAQRLGETYQPNVQHVQVDEEAQRKSDEYEIELLEAENKLPLLPSDYRKLYDHRERMRAAGHSNASLMDAATNLTYLGEWQQPDMDKTQERHDRMTRSLQEAQRVDRAERLGGDDLTTELEPSRKTTFHAEDDQERHEYLGLRAQGHTDVVLVPGDGRDDGTGGDELEYSEPGWAQES